MIWISFGKWERAAWSTFKATRCYKDGYKWTPFIYIEPRYRAADRPFLKPWETIGPGTLSDTPFDEDE